MTTSLFRREVLEHRQAQWQGSIRIARPPSFAWLTGIALVLAAMLVGFAVWGEVTRQVPGLRKRRHYGSYMGEISRAPDNLVNRDFSACAPNMKWLTDITEFQIPAGKIYLCPMIDGFDGLVVIWSIGTRLDAAIDTVAASSDLPVVHSDRGGHYRWPGWHARMADARLTRSMSHEGCSPDSAACEGFFWLLKR